MTLKLSPPLRFADYIRQLPSATVYECLLLPRGLHRRIISSSLIDELQKRYATAEAAAQRYAKLSDQARQAVALAYLTGSDGLSAEVSAQVRTELLHSFLVYLARDPGGAFMWMGFDDFEGLLRPHIVKTLCACAQEVDGGQYSGGQEGEKTPILRDFAVVCACAFQGRLRTTHTGNLERCSAAQLKKLLHGLPSGTTFESKEADRKAIINLLINYGLERGVLTLDGEVYRASIRGGDRWNSMTEAQQCDDFMDFARIAGGAWRIGLLHDILSACDGWLCLDIFPEAGRERACKVLRIFCYAGLITAVRHGGKLFFRRNVAVAAGQTRSGEECDVPVTILPDFTAVIPREIPPRFLFSFSQIGRLTSLDQVYTAAVDRETVNSSLSRGIDAATLLEILKQFNAPENVAATVREWIREFSRLSMRHEHIIISADEKTSRQIDNYDPMRTLVQPLENVDKVYIVRRGQEKYARDILVGMGFDPRPAMSEFDEAPLECRQQTFPDPSEETNSREPVVDFAVGEKKQAVGDVRSGKYGSELKILEPNEIYHVIEYAILMGDAIKIDYEGCPRTRKGIYKIVPLAVRRGKDACLEAEAASTKKKRVFDVHRIKRIGVEAHGKKV